MSAPFTYFGAAVTVCGDTAAVGAFGASSWYPEDGAAFVFAALRACPCDFDGNGVADTDDFFDYLNAFLAGDPRSDENCDRKVDADDFFDFINSYLDGCF